MTAEGGDGFGAWAIRLRYPGTLALDDVSLLVPRGQVTAVVGGDGAGKTSLLRCLAGVVRPESGVIRAPGPLRTGYLPASSGIYPDLTVMQNLSFRARAYGMDSAAAARRAAELTELAGLAAARDRLGGQLSGGMRQKLGVIAALLHKPDLLILDEPSTGVDPVSRSGLWSLIASAAADDAAVVLATTYIDDAQRAASVLVLDAGRSLAAGTPDQIVAAMPGSVRVTSGRPEGSAGAMAWRRGAHWRVWCPPGTSYPGAAVNPDLQDAVTVAALAGELAAQADRLDAATDVGTPAGAIAPASAWRRREGARERPPRPKSSLVDALAPHQSAPPGAEVGAPAAADSGAAPGADVGVMPPRSSARWPLAGTERVTCRFGQLTAVRDVSIQIWPGEIVGLIGANGAGKTTLIRMLLGLVPATSGQVALLGEPPSRRTRSRIGYVPQGLGLYADLTAEENMEFAATVFGSDDSQLPAEVRDRPGIPVGQLPLGLQRRVAFAQALAHDPELLILDEPTSGVDPLGRARLWQTIAAAVRAGAGALVSTHYMEEAGECDRLIIMADGAVVAAGTAAQIIGAEQVTVVESASWADSFSRLERAGLPVALAGRTLRIPGVSLAEVRRVLGGSQAAPDGAGDHGTHGGRVPTELPTGCRIYQAAATLEERFFELASAAPQVTPVPA